MIPRTLFAPEHQTFRDSVRRFLEAEVKPHDERWQEQGRALTKPNTVTDFIAVAEHLIARKYTSPDRLAIQSLSAGGVLIGGAPGVEPCPFAQQREFFVGYVSPWVSTCCDAIKVSPIANYYRRVAEFTQYFMAIERDSFAID